MGAVPPSLRFSILFALPALLGACTSPPSAGSRSAPAASEQPALAKGVVPREPRPAPAPEAAPEPPRRPPPPALDQTWSYVMPVDHGVRSDDGGRGGFLAPRYHGRHNGLDLLAPIGTPALSPCDGKARSGASSSFGRWVQVVCRLPRELSAGQGLYASIFYSHLSKALPKKNELSRVRRGETVGAVGKSGNASGSSIAPHLHLEIIVHAGEDDALAERHSGRNQSETRGAKTFLRELEAKCLEPNGFARRHSALSRARRLDPFVVLSCLAPGKPALSSPKAPLDAVSERWSEHYTAETFDVDVGRRLNKTDLRSASARQ